MVMAYRETKEDRFLMKPYRFFKGEKIDIRWSGGWLTPEGAYLPVNYSEGICISGADRVIGESG